MSVPNRKKITIAKEDAVFWMDKDGNWQNEHGRFEHPKVIRYFHTSIQKDKGGYFVSQATDEFEEKVYFKYEDTAIFVFDLSVGEHISLVLNTGEKLILDPDRLAQKDDALYLMTAEHRIKFTQRALVKLSKYLMETDGRLWLKLHDQSWEIE